jgi:hypothetical protein
MCAASMRDYSSQQKNCLTCVTTTTPPVLCRAHNPLTAIKAYCEENGVVKRWEELCAASHLVALSHHDMLRGIES